MNSLLDEGGKGENLAEMMEKFSTDLQVVITDRDVSEGKMKNAFGEIYWL